MRSIRIHAYLVIGWLFLTNMAKAPLGLEQIASDLLLHELLPRNREIVSCYVFVYDYILTKRLFIVGSSFTTRHDDV